MAILQIFDKKSFFSRTDPSQFRPGQICWIVVPIQDPIPRILDIERRTPEEHTQVKFYLRNANRTTDFRSSDRTLPIKYLNLRSNEELLVQRAKKRPGIILSSEAVDIFPEVTEFLKQKGKPHLQEDSLFAIPCFGVESDHDPKGFPKEMVARIRCLLYRQFFYMPGNETFTEGVARFDRIQTIIGRNPSTVYPTDICFSEEVFALFLSLFVFCITGIEEENLKVIRTLTKEAYQKH